MASKDFIGRERELNVLGEYFVSATAGRATYVFISGEAGMGKSRLADEFAAGLGKRAHVLSHRNTQAERSVPFAALKAILGQCKKAGLGDAKLLSGLLDKLNEKSGTRGDRKKETELMQAGVIAYLDGAAKKRPLIISLGEVQWLDASSVSMVQKMIRDHRKSRLLFIGTYCPDELEDSAGNALPFTEAIATLLIEGLVAMIPLERLSMEETGRLVARRAGLRGEVPKLTALVHGESEGLPLFTIELVDALLESGEISPDRKDWAAKFDASKVRVPKGIRDTIGQRLDALGPGERDILSAASVLGSEFRAGVLAKALGKKHKSLAPALSELVSRKLVGEMTEADEETYRFVHSKIQQVAYASQGKSAPSVHAKAAKAILALHPDVPAWAASELASHFSKAGDHGRAAEFARKAAVYASNALATEEAVRFNGMAVASLSKVPPSKSRDARQAEALAEMAWGQYSTGDWSAALAGFRKAMKLAKGAGASSVMTNAANGLGEVLRFQGDYVEAAKGFNAALEIAEAAGNKAVTATALKGLGYIDWRLGQFDAAEKRYARAYDLAKEVGDSTMLGIITLERGNVSTSRGDLAGAEKGYRESIALTEQNGDMFTLARAYNNLGDVALQRADWDSAISDFEMCAGIARSIGNHDMLGWALFNLGEALARKGDLDRAEEACSESMEILLRISDKTGIAGIHKNLGIIRSMRGEWKKAEASFAESARMSEEMDTPHALAEVYLEWGDALARRKGDAAAAREKLGRALKLAEDIEAKELAKRARKALESVG